MPCLICPSKFRIYLIVFYLFDIYIYLGIGSIYLNFEDSPAANFLNPSVSSIGPGAIPLTLTPLGPNSTAKCLVMASTPAFAEPTRFFRFSKN